MMQPIIVEAHPFHWATESIGFVSGLLHPLTGSDHIFTMLVVGFWISQFSKPAASFMLVAFACFMLMGGGLTLIPVEIPNADNFMNLSALMLGLLIASGYKVSSLIAFFIVSNLALFHGYVHAYDIWLDHDSFEYTIGFALTSAFLITIGIAIKLLLDRFAPIKITEA